MSVTTTTMFLSSVSEYFESMSVELLLASFSAIIYYLMFSNKHGSKKSKKFDSAGGPVLTKRLFYKVTSANAKRKNLASSSLNTTAGSEPSSQPGTPRSIATEKSHIMDASSRPAGPSKRIAMRANDIRSCGRNGNLAGAIKFFEKLGDHADDSLVLNSMLDACVECHDLEKATHYFNRARNLELADGISYNKMMKCHLLRGQEGAARSLLEELMSKGSANATSYHGLLNARVNAGDLRGAWKLVADMQGNGISPNAVTCAILLKGRLQSIEEVSRVLVLVDAMEDPMDEVLFMAVAEACVRVSRLDVLTRVMEKYKRQGVTGSLSAETYGSMIKAYGRARDTKRVWDLWTQMMNDKTQLTSVTLGCMVEALVANGQSIEAWKLVQNLLKDEKTKPLVNTVICSSILKGFAHTKDTEKVMSVYKEMQAHKIQPNTITFNTILNAFAQCGTMQYAPELLQDMRAATPAVEPDIVTYSTLVKGYCYAGSLDRALQVFKTMQQEGKCKPDEVLFNSLLGGCAKEFRIEEALQLLNDMKKFGIAPSNYTLSMLVKLMCRCRRLDQAFTMLADISKEYNFKINIQVYTCLIQGCFHNGHIDKALSVYEKIINERLLPDTMTYTVLVRGCLRAGSIDKAAELVRHSHGVGLEALATTGKTGAAGHVDRVGLPLYACAGVNAGCLEEVVAALGGTASKQGAALLEDLRESSVATVSSGRQRQW